MKIPATLPVTAEQSRASRFQLGLTQANVIDESGLPGHKLKNFETGRFVPDMPFLESLRDFYQERGIVYDQAAAAVETQIQAADTAPGAVMRRQAQRMALYVRDDLPDSDLMKIFERMEANDARIESIITNNLESGFPSGYSAETEAKNRELFGAMAENHLLFRLLQGRSIISSVPSTSPATHGGMLAGFFAQSPLASIAGT